MKIRAMEARDEAQVYALLCTLENAVLDRVGFGQLFSRYMAEESLYAWVCEVEGICRGVITLRVAPVLCRVAQVAEIVEVVVDDAFRAQGMGQQLFEAARNKAREVGCARLQLFTNKRRVAAHRFYERMGMTATHEGFSLIL